MDFFVTAQLKKLGVCMSKQGDRTRYFAGGIPEGNNDEAFKPGNIRLGECHRLDIDGAISSAAQLAFEIDQVVVFAGFVGKWESKGNDRKDMNLPPNTDRLISEILKANSSAVVCMSSGGPYSMPWLDQTKALLQVWHGGNETGNAIANVLYGITNPSGKLPLSFPKRLQDNSAFLCSHADHDRVLYADDIYVGYRYYDAVDREVLFPFGHGLSYTEFEISDAKAVVDGGNLSVHCLVTNVGSRDGTETVQVYVSHQLPGIRCPPKQLRGFTKVRVRRDERQHVTLCLDLWHATAFWNEDSGRWVREKGDYTIMIGNSSRGSFTRTEFTVI
jgi:beta-glucosidase